MNTATIISAYAKGDHRYVLRFDDTHDGRVGALLAIRDLAAHPELNFTWLDAGKMTNSIRKLTLFSGENHEDT